MHAWRLYRMSDVQQYYYCGTSTSYYSNSPISGAVHNITGVSVTVVAGVEDNPSIILIVGKYKHVEQQHLPAQIFDYAWQGMLLVVGGRVHSFREFRFDVATFGPFSAQATRVPIKIILRIIQHSTW